jgi:RecG-like helicase
LFSEAKSEKAKDRLSFFIRERSGEKLARYDLELRGAGELFGTLQSGFFRLSFGSIYDEKLLEETFEAAKLALSLAKNADSA